MKFVEVLENQEIYKDGEYQHIITPVTLNVDQISLIRKQVDGSIQVYITGREKAIILNVKKEIDKLLKACGISNKKLNEDKE